MLGRYRPETKEFEEWQVPGGSKARPYGMITDGEDRLWFVETATTPNRLVGFDPTTSTFTEAAEIPSGGGTVRHMYFEPEEGSIWFGTDTNTIARATLP